MKPKTRKKFRKLVKNLKWRKTTSWRYRDCPHEYCWWEQAPLEVLRLTRLIREHGERRVWRKNFFTFLQVGDLIYWHTGGAVNRTFAIALERGGNPSKKSRERIQKRFGRK